MAKKKAASAVTKAVSSGMSTASDAVRKAQMTRIIAQNTGWTGADLETAVAIALRESKLNPNAYNGNRATGDDSYGLFQLNTLGNLWSIYQQMGFTDRSQLLDPAANARAAYALWQRNGNSFRPWLGYRAGLTVQPQLAEARQLIAGSGQTRIGTVGKGVPLSGTIFTGGTGTGVPDIFSRPVTGAVPVGGEAAAGRRAAAVASVPRTTMPSATGNVPEVIPRGGEAAAGQRARLGTTPTTATATKTSAPIVTPGSIKSAPVASYENGRIPADQLVAVPGGTLEANAAAAYQKMRAAAWADGVQLGITDSYRSYDQQADLVKRKGLYSQGGLAAAPGTSEHGWGQAIDISGGPQATAWMQAHAGEYGFVANTPREPWHYGYEGPGSVKASHTQPKISLKGGETAGKVQNVPVNDVHGDGFSSGDPNEDLMRGSLGWMAAFLDDPEVGPILRAYMATVGTPDQWPDEQFNGAIMGTNWYKTTQASAREFDGNMKTDPATMNAAIESEMQSIQARAAALGFATMDQGSLRDLATASLRLNMSQDQIDHAIGGEALRAGTLGGTGTQVNVRKMVNDYGVPMSDQSVNDWTSHIATGQSSTEDLRQQLVSQAKGLYPGFADGLDRGLTTQTLADPYIQLAASNLELNPDTIQLSDPKWSGSMQGTDPKTGGPRLLGLQEYQTKIRSNPIYGWQNTSQATAQAYNFAARLGQAFGVYAGTQ